MAKTVQSRKAKGRRFQQKICEMIRSAFPALAEDDVTSRSMGAGGTDVLLSPHAQKFFPFAVEAKNQEKLNIWSALEQAEANKGNLTPVLFFKRNRTKPYVAMKADDFIKLVQKANSA